MSQDKLKVLLASGEGAPVAEALTAAGHCVMRAADGPGALRLLSARCADALICDLPAAEAFELCRNVRGNSATAELWFILIATVIDAGLLEAAWRSGVSDLIPWPARPVDLLCRLLAAGRVLEIQLELDRRTRAAAQLNADLAVTNATLQRMAITDELTALFNRRHAIAKLNEYWAISERYNQPLACAILDLDHFKCVNDTYGHFVGDVVLRRIASVIMETVRSTDLVCRIGGEELLILFPAQSAQQTLPCAERCRATIAAQRIVCGEDELSVTVSIGVSEKTPALRGPEDMLKQADAALYAAKRSGRNCIICYGQPAPIRAQPLVIGAA